MGVWANDYVPEIDDCSHRMDFMGTIVNHIFFRPPQENLGLFTIPPLLFSSINITGKSHTMSKIYLRFSTSVESLKIRLPSGSYFRFSSFSLLFCVVHVVSSKEGQSFVNPTARRHPAFL